MEHGSEVLEIIEAGLNGNKKKLIAYTELLVSKLSEDDHLRVGINNVLDGSYKDKPVLKALEKKTLNFRWVKRLTFNLMCPSCNEPSGCYSLNELFIIQKNGDECGNCGAVIPIFEDNIQYAEL